MKAKNVNEFEQGKNAYETMGIGAQGILNKLEIEAVSTEVDNNEWHWYLENAYGMLYSYKGHNISLFLNVNTDWVKPINEFNEILKVLGLKFSFTNGDNIDLIDKEQLMLVWQLSEDQWEKFKL
jgi:hypothetical protein